MNSSLWLLCSPLLWASSYAEYSNKAVRPDLPEPKLDIKYPEEKDKKGWTAVRPFQDKTARLIAGRSEFYWLVVIKNTSGVTRGMGNLVSSLHVLTTCRAIVTMHFPDNRWIGEPWIETLDPDDLSVHFCGAFLHEVNFLRHGDLLVPDPGQTTGPRSVGTVLPHNSCGSSNVSNDLGILIMTREINPYGLWVGTIPPLLHNI
uniref:Uncharacterized protein n=1 Tax=Lygus hesperus TaxID=30085 RepID=A0A0A9Y7J6_LYGHE